MCLMANLLLACFMDAPSTPYIATSEMVRFSQEALLKFRLLLNPFFFYTSVDHG